MEVEVEVVVVELVVVVVVLVAAPRDWSKSSGYIQLIIE